METTTRQANFLLPGDLLEELRRTVSKRQQSKVVAEALRKEIKRLQLKEALQRSFGAWSKNEHPELKDGTEAFIRTLRKSRKTARRT